MPRKLITKRKQDWIGERDVAITGTPLRQSISSQDRYARRLEKLTMQMSGDVSRQVKILFSSDDAKKFYAQDASLSSQARVLMNSLSLKYAKLFARMAKPYAKDMVKDAEKESKTSLHSSLEKLSGGLSIKTDILTGQLSDIVKATIDQNVDLIKSIPDEYLNNVRGAVMRSIAQPEAGGIKGLTESIDEMLDLRNKQIRNKAKNVALDQTRKAYNNINAGRMRAVGVEKFRWRHSGGGQKPRELHRDKLNGNIYSFNDLPIIDERTGERGIPGQAINCRCVMIPVIEFDDGSIV